VPTTCLLLHGAGSCPATVRDLLGPACPPGSELVAPRLDGGVEDTVDAVRRAVAEAEDAGRPVALVGGVSLGAHAAALWAARSGAATPLVLAMPAWTGPPGEVAALTVAAAAEVRRLGRDAVLARLRTEHPGDWVVREHARGWLVRDETELVGALEAAGRSAGPTAVELAQVCGPVALVGLLDDPLHPTEVALAWAGSVRAATYGLVPRDAPGTDIGVLGRTARLLLEQQVSGSR
jgi:pimeloyl-ACP methyl ester carboxylesterase